METFSRVLYWMKLLNATGRPTNEPWVHLHGIGEPLLNPNIVEMVAKANKICPTGFSTNGDFLTEDLLKELVGANIAYVCISKHNMVVAARCEELLKRYHVQYMIQDVFDDNWAGQLDMECASPGYHCAHIETGGAMILWDGRIVTCCVDAQANPVLGNVYEDDIRHINIAPIPLCANCRSNFYWKWQLMRGYSPTLNQRQKERFFKQWLTKGLNNEI